MFCINWYTISGLQEGSPPSVLDGLKGAKPGGDGAMTAASCCGGVTADSDSYFLFNGVVLAAASSSLASTFTGACGVGRNGQAVLVLGLVDDFHERNVPLLSLGLQLVDGRPRGFREHRVAVGSRVVRSSLFGASPWHVGRPGLEEEEPLLPPIVEGKTAVGLEQTAVLHEVVPPLQLTPVGAQLEVVLEHGRHRPHADAVAEQHEASQVPPRVGGELARRQLEAPQT